MTQPSLSEILTKYGLGAFFAVMFFGVIVLYQLKPAAEARSAIVKDRAMLLNAVTTSLKQSNEAAAAMADSVHGLNVAVKNLDVTMKGIAKTQHIANELMQEFTKAVRCEHQQAQDSLDRIEKVIIPE